MNWISNNYIEIFGAVTGILYVFLEIRQNILLWPVGIITSAVYVWVFLTGKLYADMGLQVYYLVISGLGWYWWVKGRNGGVGEEESGRRGEWATWRVGEEMKGRNGERETRHLGEEEIERIPSRKGSGVGYDKAELKVSRLKFRTGIMLAIVFLSLFILLWQILDRLTDSPVPAWDSLITSLSIVATWMLARKIYEHWYIWILVNTAAALLFFSRGLYPTMILYTIYCVMSFVGLAEWKKSLTKPTLNNLNYGNR